MATGEQDDDYEDEYEALADAEHPDHDLSKWGIGRHVEPPGSPWFVRRWLQLLIGAALIGSLLLPFILRF